MVLYYHGINRQDVPQFMWQLDELCRRGPVISLDSAAQPPNGRPCFAITFDDGLTSVLENAIPRLHARGIPCTLFVPAGLLGKDAAWLGASDAVRPGDRVATVAELKALPPEWVAIGSHTLTHARLSTMAHSEARREIAESRRLLESALSRPICMFSFPYGCHNAGLVSIVREAGYARTFTSDPGITALTPDAFVTNRVPVSPQDWRLEFKLKIRNAYAWKPMFWRLRARICRL